jgi:hypothetical protein
MLDVRIPGTPDPSDCKIFPIKTCFLFAQFPLKTRLIVANEFFNTTLCTVLYVQYLMYNTLSFKRLTAYAITRIPFLF